MEIRKPKLLLYDLEVSPAKGFFYPPLYKTNILKVEKYQTLMSASWAFFEEDKIKIHHVKLDDFKQRFTVDRWDDTDVAIALHRVMEQADLVIAHNGDNFDNKMANTYFLKHGLDPLPDYKTVDTLRAARTKFRFASNKLDEIARELGMDGKTDVKVGSLWYAYMEGSEKDAKKAGKYLKAYNNQDIQVLYDIYKKLRPFIKNHPNIAVLGDREGCPKCGSHNRQYRGFRATNTMIYRQIQCNDCKSWYREAAADKELQNRPDYVN